MKVVRPSHATRRIANLFGAIGYSLLLFICLVVVGVATLWLIRAGTMTSLGFPPEVLQQTVVAPDPAPTTPLQAPSLLWQFVQAVMTAIVALIVLFVCVTLPYWLGRCGSFFLKRAIRLCHFSVTSRSLLIAKGIVCGVAAIPVLIVGMHDTAQLPIVLTLLASITLSFGLFCLQHYFAHVGIRLEAKEIW